MTTSLEPADLVDAELYASGDPHAVWRWLRAHAPVHYQEPTDFPGFWSITRYDDVRDVYRDPGTFSSTRGVLLRPSRLGDDPGGGLTLALTDPPRHKQFRSLLADWFSRRAVRRVADHVAATAKTLVTRAFDKGECDFAHDIAAPLSLSVICRIIGVPESHHEAVFEWTNEAFEAHTSLAAHPRFTEYFAELMYQRITDPADDLLSSLVTGTAGEELLTEEEILLNIENLVGATENGRLALIGGMLAFLDHPDQWYRLREDRSLLPAAIEEVLRWTSSATHSMRVATKPHVIRGKRIEAGDKVVLWLPSANRDEEVFTDPGRFDIARQPNRHIALAAGEHFCIGGTLARAEMRILFTELLDRADRVERNGPVTSVRSIAVNGPAHLPIRVVREQR